MLTHNDIMNAAVEAVREFGVPYGDPFEVTAVTTKGDVISVNFNDRRANANPRQKLFSVDLKPDATLADVKLAVRERLKGMTLPFRN